jgi:hypothetical protein
MIDFIQQLPDDIVRYIIPFTYQPQKQELLIEIRIYKRRQHYHNVLRIMRGMRGLVYSN